MAIEQTKKQSDLEKRLRLLRQQVYGRDSDGIRRSEDQHTSEPEHLTYRTTDTPISSDTPIHSDITYLHQDLLKISLLAGLALGAQIILFILLKNHVLNFNFF